MTDTATIETSTPNQPPRTRERSQRMQEQQSQFSHLVGEGAKRASFPVGTETRGGVAGDPLMAQRVSAGTATPDEIAVYRNQRAQRDDEINELRADRALEYAQQDEAERNSIKQQLQKELDKVSDEMRSISPNGPLFKSKRREKLAIAHELEDLQNGIEQSRYDNAANDARERSEQRKQLDAAKNMPLSGDAANQAINDEVPGKEQPSLEEMNPDIDSKAMLKPTAGQVRTIRGDEIVTQVPSQQIAARDAVHGR